MTAQDDTARAASRPVTAAEFAAAAGSLKLSGTIAVAFSGGPDSLALLILAARYVKAAARQRRGAKLIAMTVDHGLRPESAGEAKEAARLAGKLGVSHRILTWQGPKPASGVQAAARDARYALLAEACRETGAGDLLVAHHLEDQAETFLLRLARGSGVDGLAAMPAVRVLAGGGTPVRLVRPLLAMPRARLLATVAKSGLTPIHDPSNQNMRFERVKARRALALLAPLGLDAARLSRTATHMARARAALEAQTHALLGCEAVLSPFGHVEMTRAPLADAPAEIGLRALATLIRVVGGGIYGPRMEALEGVHAAILGGTLGQGRTLNGVKLMVRRERLVVLRELAAAEKSPPLVLKPGGDGLWDGRFQVRLVTSARGRALEVRALGRAGLTALQSAGIALPDVAKSVLLPLPGLWRGEKLVAAPHLGTIGHGVDAAVSLRPVFSAVPMTGALREPPEA